MWNFDLSEEGKYLSPDYSFQQIQPKWSDGH